MARSVQEIAGYLKERFVGNGTLQQVYELQNEKTFDEQFSKASIEARMIDVFASGSWLLENIWDGFRAEVETVVNDSYVTGIRWYYQKALEFQRGDKLVYDEKMCRFVYPRVNEEKKVVKNVAVRQVVDEQVTKLKVYFSDAAKQPLTGDVRNAFEEYMREVGAAGTHYLFVSREPDKIKVRLRIYYDPLVLNRNGERLNGEGKPVEETIESYLNALEYGGVFYASKLVDMLQMTEGIKDVTLEAVIWGDIDGYQRRIEADSGAFVYEREGSVIEYTVDQ